jgi:drug/metabolite transporter (DMT)-like permease
MNIQVISLSLSKSFLLLPLLFIVLWSSGYIAGKIGISFTGPFTLIFIRFSSAAFILFLIAILTKASWPDSWQKAGHIAVVGIFIQVLQFGGVYSGLNQGVSAGISALIIGSMPIFAALGSAWLLAEKISGKQWQGLFIGLFGVALVVSNKVSLLNETSLMGYFYVFLGLFGITVGTLYQKRFCVDMDLRTGGTIQLGIAAIFTYLLAWKNEDLMVDWSLELILSVGWLSLINSIAAISILFVLIRKGEANQVARLFYLIPPTTVMMGWLILGEEITPIVLFGFIVTSLGVYLSTKRGS